MRSALTRTAVLLATSVALVAAPSAVASGSPGQRSGDSAEPTVVVWPATRLEGGDVVTVKAWGLPPLTEVIVSQCTDEPSRSLGTGCGREQVFTTSDSGGLRISWTLLDPVFYQPEAGSPVPRYCRADQCRIFVSVPEGGDLRNHASPTLHFRGSPATVAVAPDSGLVDGQRVRITGSAKGSEGRRVLVIQQQCIQIVQEFSCSGATVLAEGRLGRYDTFTTYGRVRRILANGTDCAVDLTYEPCRITAVIIGPDGQPDDSFGVSSLGHPGAYLEFAAP